MPYCTEVQPLARRSAVVSSAAWGSVCYPVGCSTSRPTRLRPRCEKWAGGGAPVQGRFREGSGKAPPSLREVGGGRRKVQGRYREGTGKWAPPSLREVGWGRRTDSRGAMRGAGSLRLAFFDPPKQPQPPASTTSASSTSSASSPIGSNASAPGTCQAICKSARRPTSK